LEAERASTSETSEQASQPSPEPAANSEEEEEEERSFIKERGAHESHSSRKESKR